MEKLKYILLTFCVTVSCTFLIAQDNTDCFHPTLVNLPFTAIQVDTNLEKISYQSDDNFTFWYRITPNESLILNYQLLLIDNNDSYALMIYRYKSDNFCNDVITNNIKPISIKSNGQIKMLAGEVYYFSVLHLNGNGCGHFLNLTVNGKTKIYKAIQNDCMEEAINILPSPQITLIKDTLIGNKVKENHIQKNNKVYAFVINKNTKSIIDADVWIANNDNSEEIKATKKGIVIDNYKNATITFTIKKMGYQNLDTTVNISNDTIILPLQPLKIGERLIIRKIYFQPNTYVLKEESKPTLAQLLQFMMENSTYHYEIQGYTNGNRNIKANKNYKNLGEAWNFKGSAKKLSKMRAETIKNYLVKNGVNSENLNTIGYGGDKMIVKKPKTMQQAMQNIRVEIVIVQ